MTQGRPRRSTSDVLVHKDLFGNMWIEVKDGSTKTTAIIPPRLLEQAVKDIIACYDPDNTTGLHSFTSEVQHA